jgi:hypothetical protein
MRNIDFSSWEGMVSTLLGLAVVTIVMVGIRLLVMETVQQRRNRENRQINERLRTLIAAYKTLGGSFTGDLTVDPTHLRDLFSQRAAIAAGDKDAPADQSVPASISSDRPRRIRDAVEAALSDVILLGTEEQVRLAVSAATDLVARRPVHTDKLVVSLRDFIRKALDLEPVPVTLSIPKQGPTRPGGGGKGNYSKGRDVPDSAKEEKKEGSSFGGGMGLGAGGGLAHSASGDEMHDPDETKENH